MIHDRIKPRDGERIDEDTCPDCFHLFEECCCIETDVLADKFNAGWQAEPFSGCWLWMRGANDRGYGQMCVGEGQRVYAHRYSWFLHRGEIPNGMQVLHRCDTPLCVNPNHLFLGTRYDNMRDCVNKRRGNTCKLSAEQVNEIRKSNETQRVLAKRYGVDQTNIGYIKRGKTWPVIVPECSSEHTEPNTQQGQTTLFERRNAVNDGIARLTSVDVCAASTAEREPAACKQRRPSDQQTSTVAQNSFDEELCEWFDNLPKPPEPIPWLPQEKTTDRHPFA